MRELCNPVLNCRYKLAPPAMTNRERCLVRALVILGDKYPQAVVLLK